MFWRLIHFLSNVEVLQHMQYQRGLYQDLVNQLIEEHDWAILNPGLARMINVNPIEIREELDFLENQLRLIPIIDNPQQIAEFCDWMIRIFNQ
jgi:hypothetical protein